MKNPEEQCSTRDSKKFKCGDVLLSHTLSSAVPSPC